MIRYESDRTQIRGGSGLGLAIAWVIVENRGGVSELAVVSKLAYQLHKRAEILLNFRHSH